MNDFILTLMLLGALSSGPVMPFWATANRFGIMPDANGEIGLVSASTQFDPSQTLQWRWGASLAAGYDSYSPVMDMSLASGNEGPGTEGSGSDGTRIMLDELYGSLKWKVFSLDLGMKHREQDFMAGSASQGAAFLGSLSTTAGNILWSGNARSLPGYSLNLEPVAIPLPAGEWF